MNKLAKIIHENAKHKGFYEKEHDILNNKEFSKEEKRAIKTAFLCQKLALINSEVSEALEELRKDNWANMKVFTSSLETKKFKHAFEHHIKGTFEDELSDVIIRCLDLAAYLEIDIDEHIDLKMQYNLTRDFLHGKKF